MPAGHTAHSGRSRCTDRCSVLRHVLEHARVVLLRLRRRFVRDGRIDMRRRIKPTITLATAGRVSVVNALHRTRRTPNRGLRRREQPAAGKALHDRDADVVLLHRCGTARRARARCRRAPSSSYALRKVIIEILRRRHHVERRFDAEQDHLDLAGSAAGAPRRGYASKGRCGGSPPP